MWRTKDILYAPPFVRISTILYFSYTKTHSRKATTYLAPETLKSLFIHELSKLFDLYFSLPKLTSSLFLAQSNLFPAWLWANLFTVQVTCVDSRDGLLVIDGINLTRKSDVTLLPLRPPESR